MDALANILPGRCPSVGIGECKGQKGDDFDRGPVPEMAEGQLVRKTRKLASRAMGRTMVHLAAQPCSTHYDFPFVEDCLQEIKKHPDVIEAEEMDRLQSDVELLRVVRTDPKGPPLAAVAGRLRTLLQEKSRDFHFVWDRESRSRRKGLLRSLQALLLFAEARRGEHIELRRNLHFLGRGDKSQVHKYHRKDGSRRAFKELPKSNWREDGWDAVANLAVGAVCDLLAPFGAPPLAVRAFPSVVNGKIGISMTIAPGKSLRHQPENGAIWRDPKFREQETWLQILDCIGGETDRYVRNVFWDEETETLTAIDSDKSFPLSQECPTIRWDPATKTGKPQQYCIPPVIDSAMKAAIDGLSEDNLQLKLQEIGFFPEQIHSARARLAILKRHNFFIISPNQWDNDELLRAGGCTDANCCFLLHERQSAAMKKGLSPRKGDGFIAGTWPETPTCNLAER
ncbi:MAG: hypothetical protein LBB14_03700 [Puniceicoccales bacterium]|jgi:hypothetical protein|nr:hypothetical protein [Puniceicoccales bacterium]